MEMETAAEVALAVGKVIEDLIEGGARVEAHSQGVTTSQAATVRIDTELRISSQRRNTVELV